MTKRVLVTIVAILGVLVLVACGGGYGTTKPAASATLVPSKPGEIVVSATYPRFQPLALSVTKGKVITLKVTATDINHTFTIDELGISIAVGKGQTISKQTRVDKVGTYAFYCTVPGHRSAGMQGSLKVTE